MIRSTRAAQTVLATSTVLAAGFMVAAPADAAAPRQLWASDDYGTVFALGTTDLETYQTTETSCVRGDTATSAGAGRYVMPEGETYILHPGAGSDQAALEIEGAPGVQQLRPLSELPDACEHDSQPPVFDVFSQTFQEYYPFFEQKGIDWQQVEDKYRDPALRAERDGDDAALFAALRDMIAPLEDAHVMLSAGETGFFAAGRSGTELPGPDLDTKVKSFVAERDLRNEPLAEYAEGRISYADLPDRPELGYLRVSGFTGFADDDTFAADSAALDQALDAIFTDDRKSALRGLILDVRVNGGGFDQLGLRLAAQLTDQRYFAYAKETKTTAPQPQWVEPAQNGTAVPVAVLTGGSTMSAGETFTQAMIDRPAPTIRIGAPTQGVFSDILERKMPGGSHDDWWFGLPNEIFRTGDGRAFDGVGVPPEITVPVFTEEEFTQRRDSAFDRAIQWFDES